MEGTNNTDLIKNQHDSPKSDSKVSVDIWRDLLHTQIVGNGIFPQSTFAQGVLLASSIANLVKEHKVSLNSLLEQNPPQQLIDTVLEEAKRKSHGAYGVTTKTIPGIHRVWARDKRHARDVLAGFSEVIYRTKVDAFYQSKGRKIDRLLIPLRDFLSNDVDRQHMVLRRVFSNPEDFSLLLEFIGVSQVTLRSPEINNTSKIYKEKISEFMQKYSKHNYLHIPVGYEKERTDLMETLRSLLSSAAGFMQEQLIINTGKQHPENKLLLDRLKKAIQINYLAEYLLLGSIRYDTPIYKANY